MMEVCSRCGEEIVIETEVADFYGHVRVNLDPVPHTLCGDCLRRRTAGENPACHGAGRSGPTPATERARLDSLQAAVLSYSGKVYSLPRPARHHDVIWHMRSLEPDGGVEKQGFLDALGHFWTRREAFNLAARCGVVEGIDGTLMTEDLW